MECRNYTQKIFIRLAVTLTIAIPFLLNRAVAQDSSSFVPNSSMIIPVKSANIIVFPNPVPANSDITVQINSSRDFYLARILVSSLSNVVIKDETVKLFMGKNKFLISMAGFGQGNYVVRVFGRKPLTNAYVGQLMVE
jgi:hypothetical protein